MRGPFFNAGYLRLALARRRRLFATFFVATFLAFFAFFAFLRGLRFAVLPTFFFEEVLAFAMIMFPSNC